MSKIVYTSLVPGLPRRVLLGSLGRFYDFAQAYRRRWMEKSYHSPLSERRRRYSEQRHVPYKTYEVPHGMTPRQALEAKRRSEEERWLKYRKGLHPISPRTHDLTRMLYPRPEYKLTDFIPRWDMPLRPHGGAWWGRGSVPPPGLAPVIVAPGKVWTKEEVAAYAKRPPAGSWGQKPPIPGRPGRITERPVYERPGYEPARGPITITPTFPAVEMPMVDLTPGRIPERPVMETPHFVYRQYLPKSAPVIHVAPTTPPRLPSIPFVPATRSARVVYALRKLGIR